MTPTWTKRNGYWIATKPSKPGVFRLREGGYMARARAMDPRTGRQREIQLVLRDADAGQAYARLKDEVQRVRQGAQTATARTRFDSFAAQLQARKIATGKIKSAKGREKWADVLEHHLFPAFGSFYLQDLRRADVEEWKSRQAGRIGRGPGQYSPHTINTWLSILRVVLETAVAELELERNPMMGVEPLDTSDWHTFTEEAPNSLRPDDVPRFLSCVLELRPQFYAMAVLGIATGLRPSSLRPLRRQGPTPDVRWGEGLLLVRRSHTRGEEVMEKPKTGKVQRIHLPPDLLEVLQWHVETQLETHEQLESHLLFPAARNGRRGAGGMRSPSCLDKVFSKVGEAIGLSYPVTPKAMRRTYQDLARAAEVKDIVARSISGHATEAMQRRYSTVGAEEQRDALAKVVSLMAVRKTRAG